MLDEHLQKEIDRLQEQVVNLRSLLGATEDMAVFGNSLLKIERIPPAKLNWIPKEELSCKCKKSHKDTNEGIERKHCHQFYEEIEDEREDV